VVNEARDIRVPGKDPFNEFQTPGIHDIIGIKKTEQLCAQCDGSLGREITIPARE
jgi:hypothetical protein